MANKSITFYTDSSHSSPINNSPKTSIIQTENPQRHGMPHKQPKQPHRRLHDQQLPRQDVFALRAEPD